MVVIITHFHYINTMKVKKTISFLIVISLCFSLSSCLTFLGMFFPNNKTIQYLSDADLDWFENNMPIRNKECVIDNMTLCYSYDSISKNTLVRTDGFYYYPKIALDLEGFPFYVHGSDNPFGKATYRIAFYPDKTYCGSLWMRDGLIGASEWGLFEVQNDTIVVESVVIGNANTPSYGIRDILLVLSPDTLVLLSRNPICSEYDFYHAQHYKIDLGGRFFFVPYNQLPDSKKAWIKRKKWFWCDENEWKQYKKTIKKMYEPIL